MTDKTRILVAEDHLVARIGVITIVNSQQDMMVVGEADNGRKAVQLYRAYLPDVTLLDMRMPIMNGVEAAALITAEFPHSRLIALTSYAGDADIRHAIAAGVRAYLTKDVPHDELLTAIRVVSRGETYTMAALAPVIAATESGPDLSTRELQVLELIADGLLNKQIAHSLNLHEYTVKNYVKSILVKLDAQDRTQAAVEAIRRGIIHLA
jgi:DNA-binding NarL/FixJ family response regulator